MEQATRGRKKESSLDQDLGTDCSWASMNSESSICLRCGLCCDGTIFRDVELQPEDAPSALKALGLPVRRRGTEFRFTQPCRALAGCSCRIYSKRPTHCRTFECSILQRLKADELTSPQAIRRVLKARRLAEKARELLSELGDVQSDLPLKTRFFQIEERLHTSGFSRDQAALFGDLTGVYHELILLIGREFYNLDPVSH